MEDVYEGMIVQKGDIAGQLIVYETSAFRADHLHFGINTVPKIPTGNWGYVNDIGTWVDPIEFINNNLI